MVPGSMDFSAEQTYLQPPDDQVDVVAVIKGVIEAEQGAIEHYSYIVEETDGVDPVTQDMVIDDPPRRAGPQAPVRGIPARVREGGSGLGLARRSRRCAGELGEVARRRSARPPPRRARARRRPRSGSVSSSDQPVDVLAARRVERAAQLEPRLLGLGKRRRARLAVRGHGARGPRARRPCRPGSAGARPVARPPRPPRAAPSVAARAQQGDRPRRDRLDRLRDQPRALADVERRVRARCRPRCSRRAGAATPRARTAPGRRPRSGRPARPSRRRGAGARRPRRSRPSRQRSAPRMT